MTGCRSLLAALSLLLAVGACDFPRDADGTLEAVRGGTLRVGFSPNPPWVDRADGGPAGVEPELVRAWAATLGARVEWVAGSEAVLVEAIERREIHLMVAGLTADSPWGARVGFTQPYATAGSRDHVMAGPAGEGAFVLALDRFLHAQRGRVAGLTAEAER